MLSHAQWLDRVGHVPRSITFSVWILLDMSQARVQWLNRLGCVLGSHIQWLVLSDQSRLVRRVVYCKSELALTVHNAMYYANVDAGIKPLHQSIDESSHAHGYIISIYAHSIIHGMWFRICY